MPVVSIITCGRRRHMAQAGRKIFRDIAIVEPNSYRYLNASALRADIFQTLESP
jgi:hypothetical protein